ncbi:hypothetical protein BJ508DRAFT_314316 [Ascobolus immersus RN42]|uniref:Lysine-specific metallo-endopeptidase domain-containing protein n=1 Tax=Ascobolus immersus RN42 TaxID=1160509 RepID=A0A3N4HFH0_ASCIM|nr:hypothetical protein BJ508DRAFT_314316 [Ascobolus immersus RN42]
MKAVLTLFLQVILGISSSIVNAYALSEPHTQTNDTKLKTQILGPPKIMFPDGMKTVFEGIRKQRDWGTVPLACYDQIANGLKACNAYDIEVHDIKFEDCETPAILCRCNNAKASIDELAEQIGRIPVKARQYVRYWAGVFDSGCSGGNAVRNRDYSMVTIMGSCGVGQLNIYLHETAHIIDCLLGLGGKIGCYSNTAEWQRLVQTDSCVTDPYAFDDVSSTVKYGEEYANVAALVAYHSNVENIWKKHKRGCSIKRQWDRVVQQFGGKDGLFNSRESEFRIYRAGAGHWGTILVGLVEEYVAGNEGSVDVSDLDIPLARNLGLWDGYGASD